MKPERYNNHYEAFFSADSKRQHEDIKGMTNGRLLAELDDIVQVITLLDNADFAALSGTKPGKIYRKIIHEIRERLT